MKRIWKFLARISLKSLLAHKFLYRLPFVWILVALFRAQRWSQNKPPLIEQTLK